MTFVNITGFQRMRRLQAEKAEKEAEAKALEENDADNNENEGVGEGLEEPRTNTNEQEENAEVAQIEPEKQKALTPDQVDTMDVEDVRAKLDELGINYVHNTGEAKLKERLKDAING